MPPAPTAKATAAAEPALLTVLSTPEELPAASRKVAGTLLVLIQAMYLGIYLTALANLREAWDVVTDSDLPPRVAMAALIVTASTLVPVRLYLIAAACLRLRQLPAKFARMFPVLLVLDLLWALSPFLLVHHVTVGLALGLSAALVYLPFAQRSLVLMYGHGR